MAEKNDKITKHDRSLMQEVETALESGHPGEVVLAIVRATSEQAQPESMSADEALADLERWLLTDGKDDPAWVQKEANRLRAVTGHQGLTWTCEAADDRRLAALDATPHAAALGLTATFTDRTQQAMAERTDEDAERAHGDIAGRQGRTATFASSAMDIWRLWLREMKRADAAGEPPLGLPGARLVEAWLKQPQRIAPDTRPDTGIAADSLRDAVPSRVYKPESEECPLLDPGPAGDRGQTPLPFVDSVPDSLVPVLPLDVWPQEAGRGRGAPLSQGLWFELVLSLRARAYPVQFDVTVQDLIDFSGWKHYRTKKDIPRLRAALTLANNFRVAYERRDWQIINVRALPQESAKRQDKIPIVAHLPDGSGGGPLVNRSVLRAFRVRNAVAFRIWVRLAYLWDRFGSARVPDGRRGTRPIRIYATRPKMRRNSRGQLTDANGNVLLGRNRKPLTNWSDPRAVRIEGVERNPAADRIPPLGPPDLVRLAFDGKVTHGPVYRARLARARKTLAWMHKEGHIVIEENAPLIDAAARGWRILETRPVA